MRKYRIENYGIYKNIFDVQMNTWWCGWITIKTKEFNPYKAADIIKEQLKANDVIIRSWQEMSETAYNSCDNE